MPISTDVYAERCSFQRSLDAAFPRGAMCATLGTVDGQLRGTDLIGSTGRLFCCDARRSPGAGSWEYEILIDPRRSNKPTDQEARLWIRGLRRNPAVDGLWEAEIVDDDEPQRLLRLNANPPAHLRPSKRVRTAVTRVHEDALFPHGVL